MNARPRIQAFDELGALRRQLQEAARRAAQEDAEAREREARERRERDLFAQTVGPVVPLVAEPRADTHRPLPEPVPRQRQLDEARVLHESISDEFDVESLLETDEALSFRREDIAPEVVRKLRRGVWALQGQLDLHGLRREEAREQLGAFLRESVQNGWRCVRVVHGKGHGSPGKMPVLKAKVRAWLVQKSEVIAFTQARPSDGGNGALMVLLRPTEPKRPTEARRPVEPRRSEPPPR